MSRPERAGLLPIDFVILLTALILSAAIRLQHLAATGWVIDADEAIVGLMAKHITEGREWPIFYYGQAYMGSFEAILAAGLFSLFGVSSAALKAVPLVFSLLHVVLVYLLAKRFCSRGGAAVAALCTAAAPSALIMWSGKARGGFLELVAIGTFALILAVDLLGERARPRPIRFFALGLVFGLGWWINNQIIFYGVPVVAVFAWFWPRREGLAQTLVYGTCGTAGFLVGGAAFWWANLAEHPRFQSLWLFRPSEGGDFGRHLQGFFETALPIVIGARRFWADNELFSGSTTAAYCLYGALILLCVLAWSDRAESEKAPRAGSAAWAVLALFLLLVPLVFSASQFGWLSQAPRYLLPLYSVLFVVVGAAFDAARRRSGLLPALFIPALVLGLNLASNYAYGGALPGQPFVYKGQRVARDQSELYRWLKEQNYDHIHTDYWIGYRAAFETQERVTFSRFRGPKVVRIPEYEVQGERGWANSVFVLVPHQAQLVARGLRDLGFRFQVDYVGEYVVLHHLERLVPVGAQLSLRPEQLSASSRRDWLARLVDGDLGTRWGSGAPQSPGMFVELELDSEQLISALEFDYGFWKTDYARELSIELIAADGASCVVFDTRDNEGLQYVVDESRTVEVVFPPRLVKRIRFVQHGVHPVLDWSIAELKVFKAKQPAAAPNTGS